MSSAEIDINEVYKKDENLRPEDVKILQEWVEKQPHLPKLSEFQVALFLQSRYYNNELAKVALDNYFTIKTLCPDILGNKDPIDPEIQTAMNCSLFIPLPKLTPEGYTVIYFKLMDTNPDVFDLRGQIRVFDMVTFYYLHRNGPSNGLIILCDIDGVVLGHLPKLNLTNTKKYMFYLQEALPMRLKSLEYVNIVPFMDKIVAVVKPFLNKDFQDSLHLHTNMETVYERVPQYVLPQDYGGSSESIKILHEKHKAMINNNAEFFKYQDSQLVDESKRPGKPKNLEDVLGVNGSWKKLEID